MEKRHEFITKLTEIDRLPAIVTHLSEELLLNEEQAFFIRLVLEEAITNVINYAYEDEEEHSFTLDVHGNEKQLKFILTDSGVPFDPTQAPPADTTSPADQRQIGGLGIFLMKQFMDEIVYKRENDQNILLFTKNINQ